MGGWSKVILVLSLRLKLNNSIQNIKGLIRSKVALQLVFKKRQLVNFHFGKEDKILLKIIIIVVTV